MISVVMITRNEGDWLIRTVRQFTETLPADSEIIVVDDGSTDGSCGRLPADRLRKRQRGRFTDHGYAQAVRKGAARAGVAAWHPNQLRHLFATAVRRSHGLEAAQVLLGHQRADVTQVYAERNAGLATTVAEAVG